ncbi:MAG TPA: VOC family protein [Polyangiaceae bacterium]|jgi:catechol 2,3-dioxygenase-like lactoylglutathione lyase family enzyme|nr:VOC family protein [Polyangiaceae bacterium]
MSTLFRGVFLTSKDPASTARFYRDVAGLELEQMGGEGAYVYWRVDHDGLQLAIHDAQKFAAYTHPPKPESNLTHLYFKVESQEDFLERLRKMNIKPQTTDEVVVTVLDPDGRRVMFGTT